jgi:hypothetical protein
MIINKSDIPDKKIEKLIEFCKPSKNFELCDITIKNCKSPYSCDFHWGGDDHKPFIILRYGDKDWFPLSFKLRSDKVARTGYHPGLYHFPDLDSCIIFSTAHEIRHYFQYCDDKMKFWLYHDTRNAETDADKHAFKVLKKFHKLRLEGVDIFKNK